MRFPAQQDEQTHRPPAGDAPMAISDDMLMPAHAPDPHEARVDFEAGMSYGPPVTMGLIAANIAVFIWQLMSGSLESPEKLIGSGALYRPSLLEGEVWRVVSSMFLHGGPDHLFGNCVVLYILGMACEHAYGSARCLVIYIAAGIAGSFASVAVNPDPTVGASGAIFGVLGCVVAMFRLHRERLFLRDGRIGFVLLIWALYQIVTGFFSPQIANFGHIGGFLAGAMMATAVAPVRLVKPASRGLSRL